MAAPTSARATARPSRRSTRAEPGKADLRIVRPEDRARTVGAISTIVACFFFVVLFALAGLHAVVVQTQAELDDINADITALEELRVERQADLAWAQSAVGLETTALAAGYVPAADTVILAPVPPGELTPPASFDPFAPGAGAAAGTDAAETATLAGNPG
ncbi:MAG: hypothetical protein RIB98_09865 [Acidimicrobiales bacterium]